jgi:hypothetical protein
LGQVKMNCGKQEAAEQTPVTRIFKLYPDQNELIDLAIERAQQEGKTKSKSTALYYVCAAYLTAPWSTGNA